jgi:hypothetical protein
MPYAERGDAVGFAHALKQAHYYTAPEEEYATALKRLSGSSSSSSISSPSSSSPAVLPSMDDAGPVTVDSLSRVMDAIAASSARIMSSDEDRG